MGILLYSYADFLSNSYSATLMTAIIETLTAENLTAQLVVLTNKNANIAYIRHLAVRHGFKGFIVPEFDMLYAISGELDSLGVPVVKIGNLTDAEEDGQVVCADNEAAGRDAAGYLWSLGHRRFGLFCMSRRDVCQEMRIRGFTETIRSLGGDAGAIRVREYPHMVESFAPAVAELANSGEGCPTALVSTNSLMTGKLIPSLCLAGFSIPGDFSVLSFEENRELELMMPPVTVMQQPTRAMGGMAALRLAKLIGGVPTLPAEKLHCSLLVRQSTRAL